MSKVWKWCLDDNGTLLTGWQQVNNKWYYLYPNGTMAVGWVKVKDKWFYLNKDGVMQVGWLQDKGEWYYLEEQSNGHQGEMYVDGAYTIAGKSYKFNSSGVWVGDNLVSDSLVEFIKSYEGFFPNKYICPAGVPTIGYGTTEKKYVNLGTCTKEQATTWLKEEIESMAKQLKADLDSKNIKLKQNEFDSLCSFAYNCGVSALLGATLYKRICSGVRDCSLKDNFTAWSYANGVKLQGLYNRRIGEYNIFIYANYKKS